MFHTLEDSGVIAVTVDVKVASDSVGVLPTLLLAAALTERKAMDVERRSLWYLTSAACRSLTAPSKRVFT